MSSQNVGKRQVKMSFFDKMKMLLIVNIVVKNFSAFDTVRVAGDFNDLTVMNQTVDNGIRNDGITENIKPF